MGARSLRADRPRAARLTAALAIRPVASGEGRLLRALRLRALTDSPNVFGASLAEEAGLPAAEWERRAAAGGGRTEVLLLALRDDVPVGMAGGCWRVPERGIVNLFGMWVDPEVRRLGVGDRLVSAVRDWAHGQGAHWVRLGAVETAHGGPVAFYRRLGFVPIGNARPLARDPSLLYWEMIRPA